jgi:Tfp pilus assembly protein PilX
MKRPSLNNSINNQKGAALLFALIFLVILTMLALSSMNTNILDERMASNSQEKNRAFQAAETTLAVARNNPGDFFIPNFSSSIDDIGTYGADTQYSIEFEGTKSATSQFLSGSQASGGSQNIYYYKVSVTATTESGAQSSIDAGAWLLAGGG